MAKNEILRMKLKYLISEEKKHRLVLESFFSLLKILKKK